jgi:ABC-type lipoprotein release transport system permease subunit
MASLRSQNRQMFWRIVHRLLFAHRGRLFVILLALGAGAAVTAALLNLQVDAKRRLTTEFRAFGPNIVIAPRNSSGTLNLMDESVFRRLPPYNEGSAVTRGEFLYGIVDVDVSEPGETPQPTKLTKAVLVGFASTVGRDSVLHGLEKFFPSRIVAGGDADYLSVATCDVGQRVASELKLHIGSRLGLHGGTREESCYVSSIRSFGGAEDGQIFFYLRATQDLLGLQGRVSLIQAQVPGAPQSINRYLDSVAAAIPDADDRPIRQFTEAQAKIYNSISGLLNYTVALVLILTGLCVMAAMTNVAMERRNDVGLMKAIGGATRRVLRLFLVEAALLGFAGGVIGAAAGIFLSIWLGKQVFGVAAQPRLIVYPIAVTLTILVAILSAYPLRRLASVRPASVFRGEA